MSCTRDRNSEEKRRAVKEKSRKRQLSVYEVSQIVVNKKFKSRLELLAFAQEQQNEGKTDLAQFIANRGSKAVDKAIRVGWEVSEAPNRVIRLRQNRLQRLEAAYAKSCLPDCTSTIRERTGKVSEYFGDRPI